jgi:hypothetical protein
MAIVTALPDGFLTSGDIMGLYATAVLPPGRGAGGDCRDYEKAMRGPGMGHNTLQL